MYIQGHRERGAGGVPVDISPIKKLLKISVVIDIQAILRSTQWRCSGKKKLLLKIAALKQKKKTTR